MLTIVARGDVQALLTWRINAGDLWILAAVASWALYSVCLRWRPAELKPLNFSGRDHGDQDDRADAAVQLGLGARAFVAVNTATVASIGYLALFPSILATSSGIGRWRNWAPTAPGNSCT